MSESHLCKLRWAQRADKVLLKLDIDGAKEEELAVAHNKLSVKASSESGQNYHLELDFNGPVQSDYVTRPRYIEVVIMKAKDGDEEPGFWPRLTKEKRKYHNIGIDWNLWKDEDDSDDEEKPLTVPTDPYGMGGAGMPGMGGMPGMPGMGGMGGMPGMGGMGGMGGAGGMDFAKLMESMKAQGISPDALGGAAGDEEEDDDMPPALEDAEVEEVE